MYIYAFIDSETKILSFYQTYDFQIEDDPYAILVTEINEDWVQRKKYDFDTQTWVDVSLSETKTHNSLEYTHIDADGTKHWLDVFVNNLASNTISESGTTGGWRYFKYGNGMYMAIYSGSRTVDITTPTGSLYYGAATVTPPSFSKSTLFGTYELNNETRVVMPAAKTNTLVGFFSTQSVTITGTLTGVLFGTWK